MAMINYADKVALNSNSNIADINKVNATDMNELKNAFNNQVAQGWYKTGINPTFTFVSYDSETLTGVVSSNLDMTPYLNVGMKVKFTQNSAIKYAFITAITSNSITLFLGTDYSINSSAISNTYYSMLKTPYGFPTNPSIWSVSLSLTSYTPVLNPTNSIVYNLENAYLDIPIGQWKLSLEGVLFVDRTTAGTCSFVMGLSESANSQLNPVCKLMIETQSVINAVAFEKNYVDSYIATAKKRLYLIGYTPVPGINRILQYGNMVPTKIVAVCGYL